MTFKTFRKLDTGFKEDVVLKLNTLTEFSWAENVDSADKLETSTKLGTC